MPGGWSRSQTEGAGPSRGGRYHGPGYSTPIGGHPSFSSLHQLSSSSAATPSPSSSSSSTPSSARLAASRGTARSLLARAKLSSKDGSLSSPATHGGEVETPVEVVKWKGEEEPPVGLRDCVQLSPLTEESILQNLGARYKRDLIYVSAFVFIHFILCSTGGL